MGSSPVSSIQGDQICIALFGRPRLTCEAALEMVLNELKAGRCGNWEREVHVENSQLKPNLGPRGWNASWKPSKVLPKVQNGFNLTNVGS